MSDLGTIGTNPNNKGVHLMEFGKSIMNVSNQHIGAKTRVIFSFFLFGIFIITSGCASSNSSRVAFVKSSESDNSQWAISAKTSNGAFGDLISIYVNDKKIAEGTMTMLTPESNLSGTYNGKRIDAECVAFKSQGIMVGHKCNIYINSKKVTELSF
jgi:hypothetical protein